MSNNKMPKGIPFIIGNEIAERFSYYGMKAILSIFMTEHLLNSSGTKDVMSPNEANQWFHIFGMGIYFFPIIGAIISDVWWGKYKTIITLSILYCLGHLALAIDETRLGLSLGLTMIAIGSGGIKPCVSAHVGDQFDTSNKKLLDKIFSFFYISINIGAAISMLIIPYILKYFGPSMAFGIPGLLMIIATFLFFFGRNTFHQVEPINNPTEYFNEVKKMIPTLKKLGVIYLFLSVFWSLFDQTGSSFVQQAKSDLMIKTYSLWGEKSEVLPSQVQFLNPVLVVLLVPLFTFFIYPLWDKINKKKVRDLKKISVGLFIMVFSFVAVTVIQYFMDQGQEVHIFWQIIPYIILTIAEVMVSITALEFSYTQAPLKMKSLIMSVYMLSISLGNLITAVINWAIVKENGEVIFSGMQYFGFFTLLMLLSSLLFIPITRNYQPKSFIRE